MYPFSLYNLFIECQTCLLIFYNCRTQDACLMKKLHMHETTIIFYKHLQNSPKPNLQTDIIFGVNLVASFCLLGVKVQATVHSQITNNSMHSDM